MCRTFWLMLVRAACKWYRKLKLGLIAFFIQLSRTFTSQFVRAKDHQLPSTHLLFVRQRNEESLKDYTARFNVEAVRVENCTNVMALTAIMIGRFHFSLAKNLAMTFTNLLSRVHKYCNADELTNTKKQADLDPQK